jgi:hypothetical protein
VRVSVEDAMTPTKPLLLSLALCAFLLPNTAHAQAASDDYMYRFEPDDLVGETLSTTPPLLKIRPKLPRITLIRPRASFVVEMLKSVEVL